MQFVPYDEFRKEYHMALGRIVVAMSELEWTLSILLSYIVDNPHLGFLFTGGHLLSWNLEVLSTFFYSKKPDKSAVLLFKDILSRINDIQNARNDNIHAKWIFDDKNKRAMREKFAKHKEGQLYAPKSNNNVPLSELQQLEHNIYQLIDDILLFRTINFRNKLEIIPQEQLTEFEKRYNEYVKKINSKEKKK